MIRINVDASPAACCVRIGVRRVKAAAACAGKGARGPTLEMLPGAFMHMWHESCT